MTAAAVTRFVGDFGLPAMLEPTGLSVSEFKALVARREAPAPALYSHPRAARWTRRMLALWVAQRVVQAQKVMA